MIRVGRARALSTSAMAAYKCVCLPVSLKYKTLFLQDSNWLLCRVFWKHSFSNYTSFAVFIHILLHLMVSFLPMIQFLGSTSWKSGRIHEPQQLRPQALGQLGPISLPPLPKAFPLRIPFFPAFLTSSSGESSAHLRLFFTLESQGEHSPWMKDPSIKGWIPGKTECTQSWASWLYLVELETWFYGALILW